jgi:hypothetical protein
MCLARPDKYEETYNYVAYSFINYKNVFSLIISYNNVGTKGRRPPAEGQPLIHSTRYFLTKSLGR